MKKPVNKKKNAAIIASRKACRASGTGLSHYILVSKPGK